MSDDLRDLALLALFTGAIAAAALLPSPDRPDVRRAAASVVWVAAGATYIHAVASPDAAAPERLLGWLTAVDALDPEYPRAASLGAAMLRALEQGDGPVTRAWLARHPGRALPLQRPPEAP